MKGFPKTLKVGVHSGADLLFIFNKTENRRVFPHDGFEFALLQIYSHFLGATFEYYIPPHELTWGRRLPNNSWTGVLGMAHRREVDMVMGAIFMREERDLIGDPTNPYVMEEVRFLTKLPDFKPKTLVFIEPFLLDVWIAISLSLIIASFTLFLIHGRKFTYIDQLFSLTALLLQQGAEIEPEENFVHRMPFASWTLVALLLSLSYMSVLLSFMTVPKREPIVDTVEKLLTAVGKGKLKVATPRDLPLYLYWLETNDNSIKRSLGKYVRDNDWQINFNAPSAITALMNNFAIIFPSLGKRIFIRGRIIESKEIFNSGGLVLYTAKGFCCRETLNLMIARTDASGIYSKIDHFIFKRQIHLEETEFEKVPEEIKTLTLEDLSGCFILYIFGIIMAGLFFIFEVIYFSIIRKRSSGASKCVSLRSNKNRNRKKDSELNALSLEMKIDLSVEIDPVIEKPQSSKMNSTREN